MDENIMKVDKFLELLDYDIYKRKRAYEILLELSNKRIDVDMFASETEEIDELETEEIENIDLDDEPLDEDPEDENPDDEPLDEDPEDENPDDEPLDEDLEGDLLPELPGIEHLENSEDEPESVDSASNKVLSRIPKKRKEVKISVKPSKIQKTAKGNTKAD